MNKYKICPADYKNKPIQVCLITQKWKKFSVHFQSAQHKTLHHEQLHCKAQM